MNLRRWQEDCIKQALESFREHSHFLCLATPGAGKTIMSAVLSFKLLEQSRIDLILCFSPSVVTARSVQATFSKVIGRPFDGKVGAVGGSYTYQSMLFFNEDFWAIFKNHRVLVIFDEIHHCSGVEYGDANAWGEEILLKVREKAQYTLALTGTPWRSDNAPLVLSRYLKNGSQIHCDYVYGLKDAIQEKVCRIPKVILIDNDEVSVSGTERESNSYCSLADMLASEKSFSYTHILNDTNAINDVLSRGCKRLAAVRRYNPRAGGLIVASSTEHASYIHTLLENKFEQSAVLVTYKESNPTHKIDQFRKSNTAWSVSVGMVSEGTDIPRLQVCCHLSRVRTELYFRQVLGRILRIDGSENREAWLYTFAEPRLVKFANRLDEEIPDQQVVFRKDINKSCNSIKQRQSINLASKHEKLESMKWASIDGMNHSEAFNEYLTDNEIEDLQTFCFLGSFRERIVDAFDMVPSSTQ
jgi:superfamily II DNA or RNA helicase